MNSQRCLKGEVDLAIPFHDIDLMEVAWHGHYAKYFELARTNLMQKVGLDWTRIREMGFALPIVDFNTRFARPLRFGVEYVVQAKVADPYSTYLVTEYQIIEKESGQVCATASSRQIYLRMEKFETCFNVPDEFHAAYKRAELHA